MNLRSAFGLALVASFTWLAAASIPAQERPPGGQPRGQAPQAQQPPQAPQAQPPQPPPGPAQPASPAYVPAPGLPPPEPLPTVPLAQLLERVARNSNKQFIVAPNVTQNVFLGGVRLEDVNYPILLAILRNHGLAATTIDGRVNIVPDALIRSLPVPVVSTDDAKIPDDEWVQRVIVTNGEAPQLVPVLRPLMPQSAHFAAFLPNKLIIVDRYANVKRISELVKALDR
jgi:hypothetical protein